MTKLNKYQEALEKPMIPYVKIKHKNKVMTKHYYCANCCQKYFDELDLRCDKCGQLIDWGDEEFNKKLNILKENLNNGGNNE